MAPKSVSIAISGAGGAGVMTAGQMLLDAAAKAGWYGLMGRSSGPQIRGGEACAFIRLSNTPVHCPDDHIDLHLAFDWLNIERFAGEIPLTDKSVILCDPAGPAAPEILTRTGAKVVDLPLKDSAKAIDGGRANMIGLGAIGGIVGIEEAAMSAIIHKMIARKGPAAIDASLNAMGAGRTLGQAMNLGLDLGEAPDHSHERWIFSGNEAAGMGALRAGVKFCAAYPITPATEMLEWLAPNLEKIGGTLVQAEDELASINMCIGGSFGGVPSITATSGPGLALMGEALGLAVAAEVPVIVVDVMRGGPSTGIPTKSEQSDLNIALHGMHGDAPHIVTAANSIADCLFTTQWSVHLAEALQTAAIVLSDQSMGQARLICDKPADITFVAKRETVAEGIENYQRYAITDSGVSPMAIPGTPGGEYVADGLEHAPSARPSSQAGDHHQQLDKRLRKLTQFSYGDHWADLEGSGETAVITFGSVTGPVREALTRIDPDGTKYRLISLRLLAPALPDKFAQSLRGIKRALIVEQTHSKQFYHYLRSQYDLPDDIRIFAEPGPLPVRPQQIVDALTSWS